MILLLFVLISTTNISAQYIDLDYINNLTEMYSATASALNSQIPTTNNNINLTRTSNNYQKPIVYEGSGNDVIILDDLSVNIYPFLYIEHPSKNGIFKIYDSEDNHIAYSNEDTYSVIPLFNAYYPHINNIAYIEITNYTGKWKIALLPLINDLVSEFSTPIIISGDQSSILYFNKPGKIADIRFDSNGYNSIKQMYSDGTYDLVYNEVGATSTKIKIKNQNSYFSVETDGRWMISFIEKTNDSPEMVFLDNHKTFESMNTETNSSTNVSLDFPDEEIEVQSGVIGKWYECGDKYKFMIYYQPIWTKSQSYLTAQGMFLLFRVKISNLSNEIIHGLDDKSFMLSRNYYGKDIQYPLDAIGSAYTSAQWEISMLSDDIKPASELDTYLVFDVDGKYNDNWVLSFSPIIEKTNNKECEIKLTLPKISYTP